MALDEKQLAQINVAMRDPEHLKRWIRETRPFLIFKGTDLVDSLEFPDGHRELQGIVFAYHMHRMKIPTGEVLKEKDAVLGETIDVPQYKTQDLTVEEMDRCIRWLCGRILEKSPAWQLSDPPL